MLTPENAVLLPRWLLTVLYGLFALLGSAVFYGHAPAFVIVTSHLYASVWAIAIVVVSVVCLVTSLRREWEPVEAWAVAALTCLLTAYVVAPVTLALQGDQNRAAFSVAVIIVALPPAWRAFSLLRKVGR